MRSPHWRRVVGLVALSAPVSCGDRPHLGEADDSAIKLAPSADGREGSPRDSNASSGGRVGVERISVLTLNLHCLKNEGTVFSSTEARFAAIAAAVRDEQVDVVLVQELCVSTMTSGRSVLSAALESATATRWSSVAAFAHTAWAGTADEASEHVAIFAKGEGTLVDAQEEVHRSQAALRRVMLGASYRPLGPGSPLALRLYTVHLDHTSAPVRLAQAREVASRAMVDADDPTIALGSPEGGARLPLLIAGDFNAADSVEEAPEALSELGFREISASRGTGRIDHVFLHRSAPFERVSSKVIFTGASAVSDHPGVVAHLRAATSPAARLTRITAEGVTSALLAVRGDRAPLRWSSGWPAYSRGGAPMFITSELPIGTFEYKFLRDDVTWARGANATGEGERDNASTPSFEP